MKKKSTLIFILIYFSTLCCIKGQDFHFSQYPQATLNLGAIECVKMDGDFRIASIQRNQWNSVTTPYQSFLLNTEVQLSHLDQRLSNYGVGLLFNHDKAGDGELSMLKMGLQIAKTTYLLKDSSLSFQIGIGGVYCKEQLEFSKLTFGNQFDGFAFNGLLLNNEPIVNNNINYVDISFSTGLKLITEKAQHELGIYLDHINQPNQSFYDQKIKAKTTSRILFKSKFLINDDLDIVPMVMLSNKGNANETMIGAELKYHLNHSHDKLNALGMGLQLRVGDALAPFFAVYLGKIRAGISYDINYSKLRTASNYKGGTEISIVYQSKKVKNVFQNKKICPIY